MRDGSEVVPPQWSIEVDRECCLGSGVCLVYASHTFALDTETKAVVGNPFGDPIEAIRTAAASCPSGAIHFVDHGKERVE